MSARQGKRAVRGLNATEAAAKLATRCETLCQSLFPNGVVERNEFLVGNVRGDAGRSLAVHLAGEKSGVWKDFDSGEAGDLIGLIKATKGLTTVEAVTWAAGWLGEADNTGDGPKKAAPRRARKRAENANADFALEVWRSARPAGDIVNIYLTTRGITIDPPPSLREHPALRHGPTGLTFPAIVAGVQRLDGKVAAIQRIFLAFDCTKKAALSSPKMALGPLAGNTVRLGLAAQRIALAEGIENGLSILQACPEMPVWCCISVANMAPQLPEVVEEVIMCLDGDLPGSPAFEASEKAVQGLIARGLRVRRFRAPAGMDHNDLLQLPANVVPLKMKETAHG